jgi:hypothetical protein
MGSYERLLQDLKIQAPIISQSVEISFENMSLISGLNEGNVHNS